MEAVFNLNKTRINTWASKQYLISGMLLFSLFCSIAPLEVQAGRQEAAAYYEEAAIYFKDGKHAEAIIQLKNALQEDASLLAARVLLGQVYMESGDVAAAEKELHEAERLGADRTLTAVPLAKAYLKQYKYQELLNDLYLEKYPVSVRGELLAYHGHAYLEMLQFEEAEKAFKQAADMAPRSAVPWGGLALLRLQTGDFEGAQAYVDQAFVLAPDDTDMLSIKASVIHARGNLEAAIAAYGDVIKRDPSHMDARLARAGVYIDIQEYNKAEPDLVYVQEHYEFEPRAYYLHSFVHVSRNDPEKANESLKKTADIIENLDEGVLSRSRQLLMLAGLTYYGLDNYQLAYKHLNDLLLREPRNREATKLLGAVLLELRDYDEIVRLIKPLVDMGVRDYKLLTMLATAYSNQGRYKKAAPLFEEAVALSGGDPEPRVRQAINYFDAGNRDLAVAQLEEIFEKDKTRTDAGAGLAVMYIKQGKGEDAIRVLKQLIEREPDNISFNNMLGTAQVMAKQYDAARHTFEKIEAMAPKFIPIQINISRLDTVTGQYDKARQRLKAAMLSEGAPTIQLMFELAKNEAAAGNMDEAIRLAEKARSEDRNALEVRRYLVGLYQQQGQTRKALEVALEAKLIASEDLEVLDMVASAYIALDDYRGAGGVLREMTTLAGFDYRWLYRIAQQQYTIESYKEAEWSLQKAVQEKPDFIPANVALIEILIGLGKLDEAEKKLRAVQERVVTFEEADRLLGDIYLKRGDAQRALQHYQLAQKREPSGYLAIKMYQAYAAGGDWSNAVAVMQDWLSSHPEDLSAKQALAEAYLHQQQYQQAAAMYEDVLQQQPDNSLILSNLAFIYLKTGNANALSAAQKAYALTPQDASINDTLGWILVKSGQAEKGLPYLREAHSRASNNPEIRYHIAVALSELGRVDEAKSELDTALAQGLHFEGVDEARALQKHLSK